MRRPVRALGRQSFPSLAALTAGGVFAAGCQSPVCGDSRSDELKHHASGVTGALSHGSPLNALHEAALGVGLSTHPPVVNVQPSGGLRATTEVPPTPPETPVVPLDAVQSDGQMRAVGPHPIDPPAPPPVAAPHPPPPHVATPHRPPMRTAGVPARVGPSRPGPGITEF